MEHKKRKIYILVYQSINIKKRGDSMANVIAYIKKGIMEHRNNKRNKDYPLLKHKGEDDSLSLSTKKEIDKEFKRLFGVDRR